MKAVKVTLSGQDYYLAFTGEAMFAFEDAFGGSDSYFEKSAGAGADAFRAVCKATSILAEYGELARRAMGYDKGPIPTEDLLTTCSTPADILKLRQANLTAIVVGYGREVESDEAADLDLAELDQKLGKN